MARTTQASDFYYKLFRIPPCGGKGPTTVSMDPQLHLQLLRAFGGNKKLLAKHVREAGVRIRTADPEVYNLSARVREAVAAALGR